MGAFCLLPCHLCFHTWRSSCKVLCEREATCPALIQLAKQSACLQQNSLYSFVSSGHLEDISSTANETTKVKWLEVLQSLADQAHRLEPCLSKSSTKTRTLSWAPEHKDSKLILG